MKNWINPDSVKYLVTGIQLAVSVLLGFAAGYFIDKKFHSLPWWTLTGCAVGFSIGLFNFLLQFRGAKDKNQDD